MSAIEKYKVGMVVYGKVTGVKPYGAFIGFDDGVTGLVHISEISNKFVKDITTFLEVGDYCMLKVIDVDQENAQLRLSYKALVDNTRKHSRRVRFEGVPKGELGFNTIEKMMPIWLQEGEKND